jgi:hypothetical protein
MPGKLTLVESPFKPRSEDPEDGRLNLSYARDLCRFVALRGDYPLASHIFCTRFLYDDVPEERAIGIKTGLEWGRHAQQTVVGIDRGISEGVALALLDARKKGRPVIWVSLERHSKLWLPKSVRRDAWLEARVADDQILNDKGALE